MEANRVGRKVGIGTRLLARLLHRKAQQDAARSAARAEMQAPLYKDRGRRLGKGSRRFFSQLLRQWKDGRIKLFLSDHALGYRRAHADLYQQGQYIPLHTFGTHQENLCAFARRHENQWAITLVPRLTTRLAPTGRWPLGEKIWLDTSVELPADAPDTWQNTLTGETLAAHTGHQGHKALAVKDLLQNFPCALLQASAP